MGVCKTWISFLALSLCVAKDLTLSIDHVEKRDVESSILPQIVTRPNNYSIEVGRPLVLECKVDNFDIANGDTVMWRSNLSGSLIPSSISMNSNIPPAKRDRYRIVGDQTQGEFFLEVLVTTLSDEGTYSCEVFGQNTITHHVTVNVPASVSVVPESGFVQVHLGESVSLECNAEGKPKPDITWARTGDVLPGGAAVHTGVLLEFNDVQKEVAGEYVCSASNGVGNPDIAFIEVAVIYPPVVTVESPLIYTGTGSMSLTLVCRFSANPPVEVVWRHNNSRISFDQRSTLSQSAAGEENFLLEIDGVRPSDLGLYECVGGNSIAQAIGVMEVKAEPHSVVIESEESAPYSDQYTLQWSVQSHEQLVEFDLQLKEANEFENTSWVSSVIPAPREHKRPHHTQAYTLKELKPSATYLVKLRARNTFGYSDWTDEFQFLTNKDGVRAPTGGPPTTKNSDSELSDTNKPDVYTEVYMHDAQAGGSTGGVAMTTISTLLCAVAMVAVRMISL